MNNCLPNSVVGLPLAPKRSITSRESQSNAPRQTTWAVLRLCDNRVQATTRISGRVVEDNIPVLGASAPPCETHGSPDLLIHRPVLCVSLFGGASCLLCVERYGQHLGRWSFVPVLRHSVTPDPVPPFMKRCYSKIVAFAGLVNSGLSARHINV